MNANEIKDNPSFDKDQSVQGRDFALETVLYRKLFGKYVDSFIQKIQQLDKLKGEFIREDYYHEVHSKHHIMYKYRCDDKGSTHLLSSDGHRGYEFLIEFDKHDPGYGIYYGCRGLIFDGDQEKEIDTFMAEWEILKESIRPVLNNTFENINFVEARFQTTDNANNKTFWPFWISLHPGEDIIKVAALATKLIYIAYRDYLQKGISGSIPKRKKKELDLNKTRYTYGDYQRILKSIKDDEKIMKFKHFLNRATQSDIGLFKKDTHYDLAWKVCSSNNKEDKYDYRSNYALMHIIEALNEEINLSSKDLPWSLFTPIILNKDGESIDSLKQQYSNLYSDIKKGDSKLQEMATDLRDYARELIKKIYQEN